MDRRQRVGSAREALRQLRELRSLGQLTDGVVLAERVVFFAESREPSAEDLPSWIDLSIADDRLLGCALGLQFARPAWDVRVLTDDFNLQNKCDATGIAYLESPMNS
jgi:predicted ribonuclease YlaK